LWTKRQLINGIRWRARTGVSRRNVPAQCGPWQRDGTWKRILAKLQAKASRPPSRSRTTRPPTGARRDPRAAGHPPLTRRSTKAPRRGVTQPRRGHTIRQARSALRSRRHHRRDRQMAVGTQTSKPGGAIQDRYCQGLSASRRSQRRTVEALIVSTRGGGGPRRRPGGVDRGVCTHTGGDGLVGQLRADRDSGTPLVAGSSQARALTCACCTGVDCPSVSGRPGRACPRRRSGPRHLRTMSALTRCRRAIAALV
jgi:hypothetical protein